MINSACSKLWCELCVFNSVFTMLQFQFQLQCLVVRRLLRLTGPHIITTRTQVWLLSVTGVVYLRCCKVCERFFVWNTPLGLLRVL